MEHPSKQQPSLCLLFCFQFALDLLSRSVPAGSKWFGGRCGGGVRTPVSGPLGTNRTSVNQGVCVSGRGRSAGFGAEERWPEVGGADTCDPAAFRQGVSLRPAGMVSPSADLPRLLTQRHVSDCSPFMCGPRLNAAAGSWKQTCLAPRQQKPDPRGSLARPRARSAPRIGPGIGRRAAPLRAPREGIRALSRGWGGREGLLGGAGWSWI